MIASSLPGRRGMAGVIVKTCRHCLGNGCVHCEMRGQTRQRLYVRQGNPAANSASAALGWLRRT